SCNRSLREEPFFMEYQLPTISQKVQYLKLAVEMSCERDLMNTPLESAPELPFSLSAIPRTYPLPSELRLWIVHVA
ncbi:MAG: hypothetical protein K2Y37_24030, partial [Pirellulales bacterium]|nr:hypothetical protein [Pirellulales bacterium]